MRAQTTRSLDDADLALMVVDARAGVTPGEVPRLDQIDVHPTVMKLLGLAPGRPVDGHPIAAVH